MFAVPSQLLMTNSRRSFFKTMAVAGMLKVFGNSSAALPARGPLQPPDLDDRAFWVAVLERLGKPVLENLSAHKLKKNMPVETFGNSSERYKYSHLEAFGRLLAGMAPWLALKDTHGSEAVLQRKFAGLAQLSLDAATDPKSPDFMNFSNGGQPLVDTAFLAQGILRAPSVLWAPLDARMKEQVIAALKSSRAIPTPAHNNWVMFAAMVEAALLEMGEATIPGRLEDCVNQMLSWYKGDGAYGDGEFFHFDYYNSFVIQPMLLDVLGLLQQRDRRFEPAFQVVLARSRRYAEIQERMITPEGMFPPIGRSITYRFGAFQLLAQVSLMQELPQAIPGAQVRSAMTAVIRRMTGASSTWDENGWLRIGFCGHQPSLAEPYISTGSLYLCSAGLLPLGLPAADLFWSGPPMRWTSQKLWSGESLPADHALQDAQAVDIHGGIPALKRAGS